MPLFKVKTPGSVATFNNFFTSLGGFDFIDTDLINQTFMFIPEIDGLSLNFQSLGFGSTLVISNMGFLLYLLVFHVIFIPIGLILHCMAKKCRKMGPLSKKVSNYFFFNGSIRFLMEGYLDLCLFAMINIKELEWKPLLAVTISNYLAIFITTLVCLYPVIGLIWYVYKVDSWSDEEF